MKADAVPHCTSVQERPSCSSMQRGLSWLWSWKAPQLLDKVRQLMFLACNRTDRYVNLSIMCLSTCLLMDLASMCIEVSVSTALCLTHKMTGHIQVNAQTYPCWHLPTYLSCWESCFITSAEKSYSQALFDFSAVRIQLHCVIVNACSKKKKINSLCCRNYGKKSSGFWYRDF